MKACFALQMKSFNQCILGAVRHGSPCAASLEQTVLCPEMYAALQYLSPPGRRTNAAGNRNASACAISMLLHLHCFHEFQDKVHAYLMLEYAGGGFTANHSTNAWLRQSSALRRRNPACAALHSEHSFAYRDLKPTTCSLIRRTYSPR